MGLVIQPLLEAELEIVNTIVTAAYHISYSRIETLRRYLLIQPDGAFVVRYDNNIVGFGAAVDYGPFAYIGLMSVHPSMQKRGVGRLLLEHLLSWVDARGCATVLLDASPAGAPLYAHYGFQVEERTVVLQRAQSTQGEYTSQKSPEGIASLTAEDLQAVVAFDAACFGAERKAVLASYWADDPHRALLMRDTNGQISGYVIAQAHTIGPWIARNMEAGEQLLAASLALPFADAISVFVSEHNRAALRMLTDYDFKQQRTLSHMWRGTYLERNRASLIYGQVSLGLG